MSITGVVALFNGRPHHPVGEDGRMALSDHLRELRARILRCAFVIVVGLVVAMFFYDQLLGIVQGPYDQAREAVGKERTEATTNGAGGGLLLYLKVSALAAIVGTCPIWLYQIWAFIVPGLHPRERRWTRVFGAIAGPLFLAGVVLGYVTLPKGLEILIGFNPDGVVNLIEFNDYLSFFSRTLLVFGIAFEIPVFVVLLNMAGVVSGQALGRHRPWIIVLTFVFAAVATPSADPFTMTMMAGPMVVLFMLSEVIARMNDRRRRRKNRFADLDPDEAAPLP